MRSRVPRLVLSAALATSLALGLAACGDDEPSSGPRAGSSSPPSDATDATDAPGTDEPATEPAVEAATGPQIESQALRMRVFAAGGWYVRSVGTLMGATLDTDEGLFDIKVSGLETPATDLDRGAEIAEESRSIERTAPKRVENRVVQGVELFVLEGRAEGYRSVVLGGYHGGFQVNIRIEFHDDWPDADALIESMLASVEWK